MSESEIKAGDRFLVEVEVSDVPRGNFVAHVNVDGADELCIIRQSVLLAGKRIEPALKVGDKVRARTLSDASTGVIVALHAEQAWVEWQGCSPSRFPIYLLSNLERVP